MPIYEKVVPFIVAAIAKSKGLGKIKKDFTDAIEGDISAFWKKVKPLFIKEDEEIVLQIENKIESASKTDIVSAEEDIAFVARNVTRDKTSEKILQDELNSLIGKFPSEETALKVVGNYNNTIVSSTVIGSFNQSNPK